MAAKFDLSTLIGKSKDEAVRVLKEKSIACRIASEDGQKNVFPMILWVGVSLTIEDGKVTGATSKG